MSQKKDKPHFKQGKFFVNSVFLQKEHETSLLIKASTKQLLFFT
jgi:hypothetical protein